MAFGKPGRPPDDRLARQRELYEAVAPLLLEIGPRRLSMQRAARAAHVSVGGLYHWFPRKRDLVLHAVRPEVLARWCEDFHAQAGHLADEDPVAFLASYVIWAQRTVEFVRPAARAALELGASTFWEAAQISLNQGLEEFENQIQALAPASDEQSRRVLSRAIRRLLFAAMLDDDARPEEFAAELRVLIDGYQRLPAIRNSEESGADVKRLAEAGESRRYRDVVRRGDSGAVRR